MRHISPDMPEGLTCRAAVGFTRRIVGVPKSESDAILSLLFHQLSENPDFQVRFHWEPNSIAIWDNRVRAPAAISVPARPWNVVR